MRDTTYQSASNRIYTALTVLREGLEMLETKNPDLDITDELRTVVETVEGYDQNLCDFINHYNLEVSK